MWLKMLGITANVQFKLGGIFSKLNILWALEVFWTLPPALARSRDACENSTITGWKTLRSSWGGSPHGKTDRNCYTHRAVPEPKEHQST